jgi:fructokinase
MVRRSVICFGETLWDVFPDKRVPGGAPMNVALRLQRFGVNVTFLSRVGKDVDGDDLLDYMLSQSLSTRYVQTDTEHPTGKVLLDTTDRSEVRYTIAEKVAWDYIDVEIFRQEHGIEPDVVIYGSLAARHPVSRQSLLNLLDEARLAVFDVNLRPPFDNPAVLQLLLERSLWVKVNEHELAYLTGNPFSNSNVNSMTKSLRDRYRLDVVCVTMGAEGSVVLVDGRFYEQPAFPVEVVDTVGCGDAFLGSWLAAMLDEQAPQAALEQAAAVAAIVAGSEGANPRFSDADVSALIGRR